MRRIKHRPLFPNRGRIIIGFFCTWELLAIAPGSPIPTISATVKRHPLLGVVLLAALADHWYLETEEV